jgi:hypothetical protein
MLVWQQPLGATEHPVGLRCLDPRLVAALEFAGQRAPPLGPRDHIRVIGHVPVAAASGAALLALEHLGLGRVQIEGRRPGRVAAEPAVTARATPRSIARIWPDLNRQASWRAVGADGVAATARSGAPARSARTSCTSSKHSVPASCASAIATAS